MGERVVVVEVDVTTGTVRCIAVTCCGRVTMKEDRQRGKVRIRCQSCRTDLDAKHDRLDPILDRLTTAGLTSVSLCGLEHLYLTRPQPKD